jgi:hypothetical protein
VWQIVEGFVSLQAVRLDPRLLERDKPANNFAGPRSETDEMSNIDSLQLWNLAKASALVQGCLDQQRLPDIQSTYRQLRVDCFKLKQMLTQIQTALTAALTTEGSSLSVVALRRLQVRCQAGYSTLLWMALMFNVILCAYEQQTWSSGVSPSDLVEESGSLADEAVALAEQASQHRPLGSSSMPLCLTTAWAATAAADDNNNWFNCKRHADVERILMEYQADFPSTDWLQMAGHFKSRKDAITQILRSGRIQ